MTLVLDPILKRPFALVLGPWFFQESHHPYYLSVVFYFLAFPLSLFVETVLGLGGKAAIDWMAKNS